VLMPCVRRVISVMSPSFLPLWGGQARHLDVRVRADATGHELFGDHDFATSQSQSPPLASVRPRVPTQGSSAIPTQGSSAVPDRFVPGHETESVLKITKRPRLRPKDVSHRRSLGVSDPGIVLPSSPSMAFPQSPSGASPVTYEALAGLFPSTVPATHFVVVLAFGTRRVSVPGSPYMQVSALRLTAGAIADRDPELLTLMHGSRVLDLDSVLGDYLTNFASHAFHVTVAIFPAPPPVRISDRQPPNPAPSLPRPTWPITLPVTPPPVTHATFLILVVFEDGSTMAPAVWNSMSVRILCQQIAIFFSCGG
jgi:hypothetical protein